VNSSSGEHPSPPVAPAASGQNQAGTDREVRWALSLDVVAIALFAVGIVLIQRGDSDPADRGFFAEAGYAAIMLTAVGSVLVAGAIAAVSLFRRRLRTDRGRWAVRLALVASLMLPAMGIVEAGARLIGSGLQVGWGQPVMPFFWLATAGSVILGAVSREPGRRGLLMLPVILAALVLAFVLGDILLPE